MLKIKLMLCRTRSFKIIFKYKTRVAKTQLVMVKVLWRVRCADKKPLIDRFELNADRSQVSTSNGMLQSTIFHPSTSIELVNGLIVVQRCHFTEKIEIFGSNGWETCEEDVFKTFTTGSFFYITCAASPVCIRNGMARATPDQGPDLEMFFYVEDTERQPSQTRMRVVQGMIKCAYAFNSAPDHMWKTDIIQNTKYKCIN